MKPLHLLLAAACLLAASCANTPVSGGIVSQYGNVHYSPKGGLLIELDADQIADALASAPEVNPSK